MPESKVYDLIIAGAGPAGISAAIYAARKGMGILVLTGDIGGQTNWTEDIENYAGFRLVKGAELVSKFEEHLSEYGIEIRENELLSALARSGDLIKVTSEKNSYLAKSVIIGTGKTFRKLGVPGEEEFEKKGVAYCATCDAPFFSGKNVAVCGGGNSAFEAAEQLMKITPRTYIIDKESAPRADKILKDKVLASDNVELLSSTEVVSINGDGFVNGIRIKGPSGEKDLKVQGVFVEIGLVPNSSFDSELEKNGHGEIVIDTQNATDMQGVFAAGDVTNVPHKQIIVAAGEGAKAALSAYRYLVHGDRAQTYNV